MERTVVAMFDDLNTAQRALEDLLSNGFDRNDISLVRTNEATGDAATMSADGEMDVPSGAATGAGIGAALGGIAGLVVGLGVLAIPGIGPIVAAGPLATTLAGAGIGAATGGIIGALTDVGIPEDEAGYYAEGIRRGGTLLSVRATDDRVSRASQILNRFSPVNVNERVTEWQSSGWTGFDPNTSPYAGNTSTIGTGGTYAGIGGAGTTDNIEHAYDRTSDDTSRMYDRTTDNMDRTYDKTTDMMSRTFDTYDFDFRTNWE